ncbi:MAG: ribosome biogenesis GTPase Der, partial [Planctomycetales bacterium 71-10]
MALPKVVIVGRPNVGKSSLFNWLAGRRVAIVDDVAGVTRDRVGTLVQIGEDDEDPRFFELIDTGGVGIVDRDDLDQDVERQIDTAMNEADLILFVVDIREELMPLDEVVAQRLRYLKTPVILVMNKADDPKMDDRGGEFYKLGRGKPIAVSAHQNRNKGKLLGLIEKLLPWDDAEKPADAVMKIAVVGRPNTGKSTFINTLAQAERMIVSERPGTTRDSVDVHFELDGLPFMAIDTAGVKRKAKIKDDLDFYSVHRAERSIRRADVVYLFMDASQGITRLDKQLADYIAKEYKPCVFVINKWDLMLNDEEHEGRKGMTRFAQALQHAFRNMSYMPMAFITAKTGKNV